MSNEQNTPKAAHSQSGDWVKSPSDTTTVVNIHVPAGANLTPGLKSAIDQLISEIQRLDEGAHDHQGLMCDKKGSCQPMSSGPCFELVSCVIV